MEQHAFGAQCERKYTDGPPPDRVWIMAAQVKDLCDQEDGGAEEQASQKEYDFG